MTVQPLQGRKILVTAYDLEQSEHRGIAVYSNCLLYTSPSPRDDL